MSTPGLALNNLRTVFIVIVLAVHAVMAYLGSSPASSFNFDDPPYRWRSIPIVDSERWFGFDIFCAFQDVYLIPLLFFLSGLFVWPSLTRSGSRIFLRDRTLRIGVPSDRRLADAARALPGLPRHGRRPEPGLVLAALAGLAVLARTEVQLLQKYRAIRQSADRDNAFGLKTCRATRRRL
jgi:hypothetical protein